jgi:TIR domain-containing protein
MTSSDGWLGMKQIEYTVFLSYRRTNVAWALAIYQGLTRHGYDVFLDYTGIASGDFERVILENIRSRAHFLVLLTPTALERCEDPGDLFRLEIETALLNRRNIVPVMLEGFDFSSPVIAGQLASAVGLLKRYNSIEIPANFFNEAIDRLYREYLSVPLDAILHPASARAQQAARNQQTYASAKPDISKEWAELTAEEWLERGRKATDSAEKIRSYTFAIHLNHNLAKAYELRGAEHWDNCDYASAIGDLNQFIRLDPSDAGAFATRGWIRLEKADWDGSIEDFSQGIRLKSGEASLFYCRGKAFLGKGDERSALWDFNQCIRMEPNEPLGYLVRGQLLRRQEPRAALADFQKYLSIRKGQHDRDTSMAEEAVRELRRRI